MAAPIGLRLEFRGGAELLFNGVKDQNVTLPDQPTPWDIRQLLVWIKKNLLKERPELFIQGDTVHLHNKAALILQQNGKSKKYQMTLRSGGRVSWSWSTTPIGN
ncbi:ubiquitin-related modifier 1 isoform X1 [Scyliorhinus canicula]|uniref:ubiquitin-related modifier 1 isoform X1 n=1 Tax=Scyliorhinus canicula TaxID=7830 RepID=UPI0018F4885C|nr:ubiquitin-related modifier 1 isoform X1 [Scyliorhinus canicula]